MKLKEKCIYYDSLKNAHYLVLSISDMIYGRYGDIATPDYLDVYMNQDGTGVRFKIDNIIINREYYRNYKLDDKELDAFILIKELTDEEFYPIEVLIHSNYKYPSIIIDVRKHMYDVLSIVNTIKDKESEVKKLTYDIHNLEKQLFIHMTQ